MNFNNFKIDETGTGAGLREKLTREILPPALKGLVYMWDQLCCNFIQLAETSTTDGKEKVKMKGSSEEKRNENRTYQRNKKGKFPFRKIHQSLTNTSFVNR